jgi:phospholipid/cholesterol/gamma-HCH transport system substrate-binding protein
VRGTPAFAVRFLTVAAVVLAVVAVGVTMLTGGGYEVTLRLDNASQLVKGNRVKVGGVPVGQITSIELAEDRRARIKIEISDDDLKPLHQGTRATVRTPALVGIANRYISLQPGPNNAPEIDDGGEIPAEDAKPSVDLDEIVNAFDAKAQRSLRTLIRESTAIVDGNRAAAANAALYALSPAASQTQQVLADVTRDDPAFERLLVEAGGISAAVASRPDDLGELTSNTLGAISALANSTEAIDSTLRQLPGVLRRTNTTLVGVRQFLSEARPALREARPGAPLLSSVLRQLEPIAERARPAIARLRATVAQPGARNDLLDVLRGLPGLAGEAVPAFRSTNTTVGDLQPVVDDLRPYVPDVVSGLTNGFGGTTSGYYDANGHYTRISFQGSVYSLNDVGSLVQLPQINGLTGYRRGLTKRCPGAATQTAPDRSNPYIDRENFPCDREDDPQ